MFLVIDTMTEALYHCQWLFRMHVDTKLSVWIQSADVENSKLWSVHVLHLLAKEANGGRRTDLHVTIARKKNSCPFVWVTLSNTVASSQWRSPASRLCGILNPACTTLPAWTSLPWNARCLISTSLCTTVLLNVQWVFCRWHSCRTCDMCFCTCNCSGNCYTRSW